MQSFVAAHQLEVRFSHIMDYPTVNKKILAPFMGMAGNLGIDNEQTINERVTIGFEDEGYIIISMADKLIYRSTGRANLNELIEKNSAFESVFLNILTKFQNVETFGKFRNVISVTTTVDINEDSFENNVDRFKRTFLSSNDFSEFSDVAVMLETAKNGNERNITFGPYRGSIDLTKRNIPIMKSFSDLADKSGFMFQLKNFEQSNSFAFSDYKRMIQDAIRQKQSIYSKLD